MPSQIQQVYASRRGSAAIVGDLAVGGSARVLAMDPIDDAADLKRRMGFLIKDLETMGSLTSRDVLDICAAVRECTSYAHELAERLGLDLDLPMAVLSRGQLRRLGFVQAVMHKPELVVLDDPMTELDEPAAAPLFASTDTGTESSASPRQRRAPGPTPSAGTHAQTPVAPEPAPPFRKVRRHRQRCRLSPPNRTRGAVREGRPPPD
ncbi:ATP-binding cassette domain-containing protein [Kribbella sp. NBC_00889]|uniref:ATP-binding cassette domain-containing protein n=1 Tax=Kribbella sp. NBC_00889 TaxID=2975974 RepID=UPI00386FFA39|nr:hypothetical protein OG817_13690 [Kribbella sp. NBC_00889]